MTDWAKLAEPFPDSEVKQRPGAAKYEHKQACEGPRCRQTKDPNAHHQFSYVDARAVMQRLDDVVTPEGWDFQSTVIPGTDIVRGELRIGPAIRIDYGYPNSDHDEEPIKAASSDALKRCGVMFGIGRHLYTDNTAGSGRASSSPARPSAPPRPTVVREVYDDQGDPVEPEGMFAPIGGSVAASVPTDHCPLHDVPWLGTPGDYWHKDPEGKYCRHPDNVRRKRA